MPANEMRPSIKLVQRACEAAGARQAVVVWFDANGKYAVASYGETKAECAAVKPLCNAIADALDDGELPMSGEAILGGRRPSERQREFDSLVAERDKYHAQAQDTEKQLAAIAMLVSIYERQREDEPEEGWPEGDLHPSQVLQAIGDTIGKDKSRDLLGDNQLLRAEIEMLRIINKAQCAENARLTALLRPPGADFQPET